jgi:hypothetical protein
MKLLLFALCMLLLTTSWATQHSYAETNLQEGCGRLDKTAPPLFISFESEAEKVWANSKYQRGILLRLNNNSNCVITLTISAGTVDPNESVQLPSNVLIREGKLVRLPDAPIPSPSSGKTVGLYYFTAYQGKGSLVIDNDFHARDHISLYAGEHVFFTVPLKNLKSGGRILVPFNYTWDANTYIVDTRGYSVEAVEHYLTFDPERLPKNILK